MSLYSNQMALFVVLGERVCMSVLLYPGIDPGKRMALVSAC